MVVVAGGNAVVVDAVIPVLLEDGRRSGVGVIAVTAAVPLVVITITILVVVGEAITVLVDAVVPDLLCRRAYRGVRVVAVGLARETAVVSDALDAVAITIDVQASGAGVTNAVDVRVGLVWVVGVGAVVRRVRDKVAVSIQLNRCHENGELGVLRAIAVAEG